MSNRALATLAIRLLGVYAWLQAVKLLPSASILFVTSFLVDGGPPGVWYAFAAVLVGGLLLWGTLGYVLIFRSDWFAQRLAPVEEEPRPPTADPGSLQAVLFSVVGLVLVVHSIPKLVHYLLNLAITDSLTATWIPIAILALEFLIGVALFLGSRGLSRLWRRIGEMNRMP